MATRSYTTPGYTSDGQDDGSADLDVQRNRAVADDEPSSEEPNDTEPDADADDAASTPEPVGAPATDAAGVNTLQPEDIASKAIEAQTGSTTGDALSAPQDDQAGLEALMQSRYHADPAAVQAQLAAATGGGGMGAGLGNLAPAAQGAPSMESLLQNRLVELMGRSATPSASDPEIAAALQASQTAGQRAYDRNTAELAERMSAMGMSGSGAREAAQGGLRQARAETEQQISADLFKDAANRRMSELQNTLQLAGGLLDSKQQRALQLEIAQLQDATSRYGIGEGGRQFDVGLKEKMREYDLDNAARAAALGASGSQASAAADLAERRFAEDTRRWDKQFDWEKESYGLDKNSSNLLAILQEAARSGGLDF